MRARSSAWLLVLPLFVAVPLSTSSAAGQESAPYEGPIIDMHMHAFPVGQSKLMRTVGEAKGLRAPETTEQLTTEVLRALAENNVVLAVTSGPELADYMARDPDRIVAGCGYDEDLDNLREAFETGECEMLAEFSPQYAGFAPNDVAMDPYFAMVEAMDIPVGLHLKSGPPGAVYGMAPEARVKNGNPVLLEDVLVKYPDLRIWVAHAGWPMLDDMLALLHVYPRLYVDISVLAWYFPRKEFYTYLERLVGAGFGNRIMYGSDQAWWPENIDASIAAIREAPFLSEEQKRDILYDNAARFLRLSDEEIARHHQR